MKEGLSLVQGHIIINIHEIIIIKYDKINCIVLKNIIEVRTIILKTIQFLLEVEVIQGISWCVRGYTTKIHTIIVYSKHHTHTHHMMQRHTHKSNHTFLL